MNQETRLFSILDGVWVLAITCLQWGDTGKGKFIDVFAIWADIIARGTGGANAGHTISLNGREYIVHLIPSGILYDAMGKINVIGSGVAFDAGIVRAELEMLDKEKLPYNHLLFSHRAHLVLPQHLLIDRLRESKQDKIGSTGKGMGVVYPDYYARKGLCLNDIQNPDVFAEKLRRNLRHHHTFLAAQDPDKIKAVLSQGDLGEHFWNAKTFIDVDAVVTAYMNHAERFKGMIRDTDKLLRESVGKKKILCEGAQGNLLSVDRGPHPFVTSSDSSVYGLMKGIGLDMRDLDKHLGIVKGPVMTKVGDGDFPTEYGGKKSAQHCEKPRKDPKVSKKQEELDEFGKCSVNDPDEFRRGIGFRQKGGEFGATTGRCRRTGRLDLPLMRYSIGISGPEIILTKVDVNDESEEIEICHSYTYEGPDYKVADKILHSGDAITTAVMDSAVLAYCRPNYVVFPGWMTRTSHIRHRGDLPGNLLSILNYIEKETGAKIIVLSVGPDREETIVMN